METPTFNNTENIPHTSKETGETIWASRSIATCIRFCINQRGVKYYLFLKRGDNVTHTGMWCFPCGYLDFSETVKQCARRELYEETGLDIPESYLKFTHLDDDPKKFLQNITFHFDVEIMDDTGRLWNNLNDTVTKHVEEHINEGEVTEYMLMVEPKDIYEYAFGHDKLI